MRGSIGGAKKRTVAEDQQLIRAWVNVGIDSIVEANKKSLASGLEWPQILTSTAYKWHRQVL